MCAAAAATGQSVAFATPAGTTVQVDGEDYPDPLRFDDGEPVTTAAEWEQERRPELLEAFQDDVYGEGLPEPDAESFAVTSKAVTGATRKTVAITIEGPEGTAKFTVTLFVPTGDGKPRGTFLLIDHRGSAPDDPGRSSDYAPVSTVLKAGYAFASFKVGEVAPDDSRGYRNKMINLFQPADEPLPDDAGRAISAWAWAASRAMDYLATDPDIDPARVAVIGHSRGGKAALWAGAQDTRFAAVISNDSGAGGAKPARRGPGESVGALTSAFPHWFPPAYRAFADHVDDLPVDQHELLALVAPRRVVVASATDDGNSDPHGEFLAYRAAAPVYRLYGLGDTGLPSAKWPPQTDHGFAGPAMSYHLRSGGHGLTAADWALYLSGDLFSRPAPAAEG